MISDLKIFFTKEKTKAVENLTEDEKAVIREYFFRRANIIKFDKDNPIVLGLLERRILSVYSSDKRSQKFATRRISFKINFFIKRSLIPKKHLGISKHPSKREMASFYESRPSCVKYKKQGLW